MSTRSTRSQWSWGLTAGAVLAAITFAARGDSDETPAPPKSAKVAGEQPAAADSPKEPAPAKKLFKGRVVKTHDALQRRGVKAYPEELKNQVALETKDELIPILPDWRGRAFYQDERLRDRDVELIGFRRAGLPYLNVLAIYTFDDKGRRHYTDYWCDICSIPMYELKPCDCCQEEIRLRSEPQELPKDIAPK